jgi:hypothetical protein
MRLPMHQDFKRLVVVVPASFADRHDHHLNGLREKAPAPHAPRGRRSGFATGSPVSDRSGS